MKPLAFITAFLLIAATMPSAGARNIYVPTYDELFAKSDFVVIARPTGKTRDTRERATLSNNISPISTDTISPSIAAIRVVTDFECLFVIKGAKRKRFTLHHYREGPSGERTIVNGPTFMTFDLKETTQTFLMFLVRERDGRFAPVVGQLDPDLSIQQLQ